MKDNKNKLFGGMGPEKAGELGGSAPHKCRGRECNETAHGKDLNHHSKAATTDKTGAEHDNHENADHSKSKHPHSAQKTSHKATTDSHKKN